MAKVRLDFTPPQQPDISSLHIYESILEDGPFTEIEEVTSVGTYPNYITYYTTANATAADRWFSIAWETNEGILGERSASMQGGTNTVVHQVVSRVMLRDPTLNEIIVTQTAEAVVAEVMGTEDPYDPELEVTYRQLEGMTLLTLARTYLYSVATTTVGSADSWVAGLVSIKSSASSSTSSKLADLEALIKEANRLLGRNYSIILLMKEIAVGDGQMQLKSWDQTRLLLEIE